MFRITHTGVLSLAITAMLATAGAARAEIVLNTGGNLTYTGPSDGGRHSAIHNLFMEAGKRYRIDMNSVHFDTYLKLKTPWGGIVAQDDDNGPERNSKIVYTPTKSGMFRIIATTYMKDATGAYSLRV